MTVLERRLLAASLLLGVLTLSVITGRTLFAAPHVAAVSGTFYGVNEAYLSAGSVDWPQKNSNWCAVAAIELVANYTYQSQGGQSYFPFHVGGQQQIAADLNSAASVSQWGTPSYNGVGPGFAADIARDFGTDPRSITWSVLYESAAGPALHVQGPGYIVPRTASGNYTYHNVVYHQAANLAVAGMARALTRFGQPILVTTAHGLHTVVVSGVWATSNPVSGYPADVNAVNVWDPGVGSPDGGYQSSRLVTWSNYTFNTNANAWGSGYSANGNLDPDPAVGIYVPTSQYPSHWIGFRVDIEPDSLVNVSVDYSLDENGAVMSHRWGVGTPAGGAVRARWQHVRARHEGIAEMVEPMGRLKSWRRRIARSLPNLRVAAFVALLAVMIGAFLFALATQAGVRPSPGAQEEWIPLASTAPGDVLSAARATTLYQEAAAQPHTLQGQAVRAGSLGTPQLVHVFHPLPGMYDVWVVPLMQSNVPGLSAGQQVVGMFDLDYDAAQQRVRAVSFAGPFQVGEPAYGRPFPQQTQQTASAAFTKASTAPLMVSAPPELVYFPADLDAIAGAHATVHWVAGGQFPDLAVWHVRSTDNHDFIVGLDNHVYPAEQLPFAKGAG